jgi:hypothetical protein
MNHPERMPTIYVLEDGQVLRGDDLDIRSDFQTYHFVITMV